MVPSRNFPTSIHRARDIWPILVANASSKKTITYGYLATERDFYILNVGKFLDPIKCYCWHNELPPLTALAVNKDTGKPSHQLPGVADYGTAQREVFQHSWSDIPPTPQDLQEAQDAFKRAHLG